MKQRFQLVAHVDAQWGRAYRSQRSTSRKRNNTAFSCSLIAPVLASSALKGFRDMPGFGGGVAGHASGVADDRVPVSWQETNSEASLPPTQCPGSAWGAFVR
jgi:hypothetical protein